MTLGSWDDMSPPNPPRIDRAQTIKKLKNTIYNIKPESEDDDAAAEFRAEIESIIEAIVEGQADFEIKRTAEWVGHAQDLVWRQS